MTKDTDILVAAIFKAIVFGLGHGREVHIPEEVVGELAIYYDRSGTIWKKRSTISIFDSLEGYVAKVHQCYWGLGRAGCRWRYVQLAEKACYIQNSFGDPRNPEFDPMDIVEWAIHKLPGRIKYRGEIFSVGVPTNERAVIECDL